MIFTKKGQSMVELGLFLPLLAFFVLAIIEVCNMYLTSIKVGVISRDLASTVFRNCRENSDPAILQKCLRDSLTAADVSILPQFAARGSLTASIYGYDATANFTGRRGNECLPAAGGDGCRSKFSDATVDSNFVQKQTVVGIGEVYYQYLAVTPVQALLNFLLPDTLYENTVF